MAPNSKAEDIEADAAAWFEKREWSNWDEDGEERLQAWLSQSTAHRIAFIRLEAAWERAERLKVLAVGAAPGCVPERGSYGSAESTSAALVAQEPDIVTEDTAEKTGSSRLRWTLGAAASLVAALIALSWYQSASRWQTYGTQFGTVAPVALADGSRITLNSNTRLRVALDKHRRLIRLDRGEALFDVAKDPSRPLTVEVADKRVTAIGTEFSVRRESDDIAVLVKTGRVRVASGQGVGEHAAELEAGGQATSHGDDIVMERVSAAEVDRALSWREGYLAFDETPLPDAVAEFNRYRAEKIEIQDPSINAIRIGGRFRITDAESFLTLLQRGFPVAVIREDNHIVLTKR